jgi:hypothetical protein
MTRRRRGSTRKGVDRQQTSVRRNTSCCDAERPSAGPSLSPDNPDVLDQPPDQDNLLHHVTLDWTSLIQNMVIG